MSLRKEKPELMVRAAVEGIDDFESSHEAVQVPRFTLFSS
jgi:hypothetical protein